MSTHLRTQEEVEAELDMPEVKTPKPASSIPSSIDDEWLKAMNLTLTAQLVDTNKMLLLLTTSLAAHLVDMTLALRKSTEPAGDKQK
jgi:hypothetical protein